MSIMSSKAQVIKDKMLSLYWHWRLRVAKIVYMHCLVKALETDNSRTPFYKKKDNKSFSPNVYPCMYEEGVID